jgi:hypothetical protein
MVYALWFGMKADRFDETAVPYLETALPMLASWKYEQLEPLLSPAARRDFENEKVRAAYRSYDRLGRMISMEKPQYVSSQSDSSDELGDIELVDYQVVVQLESGPAMFKVKLVADGRSYFVHHFGIRSESLVDPSGGN